MTGQQAMLVQSHHVLDSHIPMQWDDYREGDHVFTVQSQDEKKCTTKSEKGWTKPFDSDSVASNPRQTSLSSLVHKLFLIADSSEVIKR